MDLSDLHFHALIEATSDAVVTVNSERRIIFWNKGAERMFGYVAAEILHQPLTRLMPESYQQAYQQGMEHLWETGEAPLEGTITELWGRRKDSTEFPLELSLATWETAAGWFSSAIMRDSSERSAIESALRQSRALYQQMFAGNQAVQLLIDPTTGAIVEANPAACRFYGYPPNVLCTLRITDLNTWSEAQIYAAMAQAVRSPQGGVVATHRLADGSERSVEVHASTIYTQDRLLLYTIIHDISEREAAQHALEESEARYRSLLELLPAAVVVHSGGTIVYVNVAAADLLGDRQATTLLGRPILTLVAPESQEVVRTRMAEITHSGVANARTVQTLITHAGRVIVVEVVAIPVIYQGQPAIQLVIQDITARKQAEDALRASEAQFRSLVETSPDAIIVIGLDGTIEFGNGHVATLHGYHDAAMLIGRNSFTLVAPESHSRLWAGLQQALTTGSIHNLRYELLRQDGTYRSAELNAAVMRAADGTPQGFLAITRDITEQVAAADLLERQVRQHAAVAHLGRQVLAVPYLRQLMQLAITLTSATLDVEYGLISEHLPQQNALRAWATTGWAPISAPSDVLPITLSTHIGYTLKMQTPIVMDHILSERRFRPSEWLQKIGAVSGVCVPIEGPAAPYGVLALHTTHRRWFTESDVQFLQRIAGVLSHAIQRRRAEEARLQLAGSLQLLLNATAEGIYGLDRADRCTFINPAGAALLGYAPAELVGQMLHPIIHHSHADGTPYSSADCPIRRATRAQESCREEQEVFWRRDGTAFAVEYSCNPIIEDGVALGSVVTFMDITERKHAQAEHQARELAESASRAKSEFLSRISHELRTPLNAILGFAQILEMDEATADQSESINYILRAGRHLLGLVNEVLDISRIEAGRMTLNVEPVALVGVLEESMTLVGSLAAAAQIHIRRTPQPAGAEVVLADFQRLTQILLNLLTNAIKYNRQGGSVVVSSTIPRPGWLRISVEDTGWGIASDQLQRLFVPFERLDVAQPRIEGTGLGLALSKGLIEAMGGTIGVTSSAGVGSTFWIELPLAAAVTNPARAPAKTATAPTRPLPAHSILYIEDNLSNLKLVERVLETRPQVRLIAAMQGQLGVQLAREHQPHLILLDQHLPDLSGEAVLQRLQADPVTRSIPVVMIGTNALPRQIARLQAAGVHEYLSEPLDIVRFLAVLDGVLQRAGVPSVEP